MFSMTLGELIIVLQYKLPILYRAFQIERNQWKIKVQFIYEIKSFQVWRFLNFSFVLDFERAFYDPLFSRNLILVLRLLPYVFKFDFIGTFFIYIKTISLTTVHGNIVGIKHRRLDHISIYSLILIVV